MSVVWTGQVTQYASRNYCLSDCSVVLRFKADTEKLKNSMKSENPNQDIPFHFRIN